MYIAMFLEMSTIISTSTHSPLNYGAWDRMHLLIFIPGPQSRSGGYFHQHVWPCGRASVCPHVVSGRYLGNRLFSYCIHTPLMWCRHAFQGGEVNADYNIRRNKYHLTVFNEYQRNENIIKRNMYCVISLVRQA